MEQHPMTCTEQCWTPVPCPDHGNIMPPRGRSVAAGTYICCDNHTYDPAVNPRHLWDIHDNDRTYFDLRGWEDHNSVCLQCNPELDICPGCDREAGVDDDFGRDEDCDHCFIDGAPETQTEVTSPAYYNTDCWCEERPVRDCPVHGPCFCGSPKCEACAP